MNDGKFKLRIVEAVALLIKFGEMTDKSDRGILRDHVRAAVKELTSVRETPRNKEPSPEGGRFP